MKKILFFLFIPLFCFPMLVPRPFTTDPLIYRLTRDTARKYIGKQLYAQPYSMDGIMLRNTDSMQLFVSTDIIWNRMLYALYHVEDGERKNKWIKEYGKRGNIQGRFYFPKGVCIDTTVYNGEEDVYYIYVADAGNHRIVMLKYNVNSEEISWVKSFDTPFNLSYPADVTCCTVSENYAIILITDTGNHRIIIFKGNILNNDGIYIVYGGKGSEEGKFFLPRSATIVPQDFGYYIFVADAGNKRIVELWMSENESIEWEKSRTLSEASSITSVEVSPADGMVYVLDKNGGKIFGLPYHPPTNLSGFIWSYGSLGVGENQHFYPTDIGISGGECGVTEEYTNITGIRYYWLDTEVWLLPPQPEYLDPSYIDGMVENNVCISFKLTGGAKVCSLKVYNEDYTEVKNVLTKHMLSAGIHHFLWDGKDFNGYFVEPGIYHLVIYAVDMYGDEEEEDYVIHEKDTVDIEVLPYITTGFSKMTAYNGGNKCKQWSGVMVGYTDGVRSYKALQYPSSPPRWYIYDTLGYGVFPAICKGVAMDGSVIYSAWLSNDRKHIIYEGWELPIPPELPSSGYFLSPPDIDCFWDTLVNKNVINISSIYAYPSFLSLLYWRFYDNEENLQTYIVDYWSHEFGEYNADTLVTSISADALGNVYILWEKNQDIWAAKFVEGGYFTKINLTDSMGIDFPSLKPCLDRFGGFYTAGVWLTQGNNQNIIYRAYPIAVSTDGWIIPEIDTVRIIKYPVNNPFIKDGVWVLWEENTYDSVNARILGRIWNTVTGEWSPTVQIISGWSNDSRFPQGEVWNLDEYTLYQFACWTEEIPEGYMLAKNEKIVEWKNNLLFGKTGVPDSFTLVPLYYIEGGINSWEKVVKGRSFVSEKNDYGKDSLVYFFPKIYDEGVGYGVMLEFYDSERIKDSVVFEIKVGSKRDTISYKRGKLIRKFYYLPSSKVLDWDFKVRLKKLKGKYVFCSRLLIWEYGRGNERLIDMDKIKQNLLRKSSFIVYPTISKERVFIWYELRAPQKVSIEIYDVAGRRVRRFVRNVSKPGVYNEVWDGRDVKGNLVSSGVYFVCIRYKGYKNTQKVIMIR